MIIRHPHNKDNPYFMMNRSACDNEELSMKALGLHTYLMSKPDGWKIIVSQLMDRFDCGRDAIRTAMNELREQGYLEKIEQRNDKGQIVGNEVAVYEYPVNKNRSTENPKFGEPNDIVIKESLENKETTKDLDDDFGQIIGAYQDNIGIITPILGERIKDAMNDYPTSWIIEAITEATTREARSWNYVMGCLKNWKRDGKSTSEKQEEQEQAKDVKYEFVGGDIE